MIYADNAATTKMSAAAIQTMVSLMNENYGNPSSLYSLGQKAKETLEDARKTVAEAIGADPREIYFTSAGRTARRTSFPPPSSTTRSCIHWRS